MNYLKFSKYNHFVGFYNKLHLIFNARTAALLRVNKTDFSILENNKDVKINNIIDQLSPTLLEQLKTNEILIPNDMDEILMIKADAMAKRYANNSLSLTIAPTLDCNFSCIYCYEKHRSIYMNQSIKGELLSFIEWNLQDIKYLDIIWYGGEPLLAKDLVFDLTDNIIKLSEKYNVNSKFSMITNGYLLTKDVASRMNAIGIDGVQITIDGPPDIHNTRRPLYDGSETFNTIIENIKACKGLISNLTIRINIDKNNLNYLNQLKQILYDHGIPEIARLVLANVDALSENNKQYEPYCLSMQEFSEINLIHLIDEFKSGNYDISPPPMGSGCGAIASNSWVIAPDGNLYKCWCDIGYDNKRVGHLLDITNLKKGYYEWLSFDILNYGDCKECDILPLCMGACPDKLIKLDYGNYCTRWKFLLKEMLILYYLAKSQQK